MPMAYPGTRAKERRIDGAREASATKATPPLEAVGRGMEGGRLPGEDAKIQS
jgi:hypothetical protein